MNDLLVDLMGQFLVPRYVKNDGLGLLARQPIEAQHGYVRLVEPLWEKFWPKTDQDENPSCLNRCNESAEQLKRARINPVRILEYNNRWPRKGEIKTLSEQHGNCEIPLPLRRQVR